MYYGDLLRLSVEEREIEMEQVVFVRVRPRTKNFVSFVVNLLIYGTIILRINCSIATGAST